MVDQSKSRALRVPVGKAVILDFDGNLQRHNTRPEIVVIEDDQARFWGALDSVYMATFGDYDLDCMVGTGRTPLDAIVDLLDQAESV